MIKSIRLLNWRSHRDSKFEFREGTNLLVGMMGAGKSSVLEGVAFAFFGTFPALERRKLRLDDIIRLSEPKARVVLEFGWDGSLYRIERAIERSKKGASSDAELYRDDRLLDQGPSAVSAYLRNLTGVDYDLFTRAIYSEQNNIDYFLTLDPRKRKQEIDALLGLDRFEDARANAVTVIGRIRSKREAVEARFSREKLGELERNEKSHAEKVSLYEKQLSSAASARESAGKELAGLSSSFEKMKKQKELFERLDKELIRLSALRDSLQKEAAEVDEAAYAESKKKLSKLSEERTAVNASLKSCDEKRLRLSNEAGSIEAGLKSAADAAVRLEAMKKELSAALGAGSADSLLAEQKEAENSLRSLDSERECRESEVRELSELLTKLRPGVSECPLCGSTVSDVAHIKSEKNALVEKKRARLAELARLIPDAKKKSDGLLARMRKASLLSEQVSRAQREAADSGKLKAGKAELEGQLASVRAERDSTAKKLDALSEEIEKLRVEAGNAETLLRKKRELGQAVVRIGDVEKQLADARFDPKSFESLQESFQASRIRAEKLASEKQSLEAQLRMANELLGRMRQELGQMRQSGEDAALLSKLEEELSIYKNALVDTQTSLRGSLVDAINSAMNDVWPIFYPYRNYHALRLEVTDRDYLFEVNNGSDWKSLESMASGGERATAALTLRVALAMVLTPKLSWLILDEPTHNLDSDAIELLSSALQFKVPEVVKQTFVITHEEGLMGSDFASSYRLSRDKEHNGETKIEAV